MIIMIEKLNTNKELGQNNKLKAIAVSYSYT